MKLAKSSFYYRPKAKGPERMEAEADLRDRIEAICLEFPRYGYRRVTHQLKHERKPVNHKKVLRLMRESDLLCRVKRKWVRTTDSCHHFPRYPNLIKGMVISQLNQVWLADITYIRIRTGFVYLAAILDACSRRVIGYAVSTKLDTALTLEALRDIHGFGKKKIARYGTYLIEMIKSFYEKKPARGAVPNKPRDPEDKVL